MPTPLREPVGVVGQIIPWNFPLLMAAWKLGPALATGCCVVLKPAEQTPLTALRLGELIQEAGFPDGVVNIVPGYGETAGAALAAHPDVDKIAFTGSTEVGKLIVQAATGNLKKVSLELGGKSPNIVFDDADIEADDSRRRHAPSSSTTASAAAPARGSSSRRNSFDKVVDGVSQTASKIRVGPGLDPDTDMGPLVSEEQTESRLRLPRIRDPEGAKATAGGKRARRQGLLRQADGAREHQRKDEGGAGRNLRARGHRDSVQAISTTSVARPTTPSTVWPPASGPATSQKAHRVAAKLRAGTVWINCYNVFDAALPFGGYKQSGWGREMGHEVLEIYTEVKSVCLPIS